MGIETKVISAEEIEKIIQESINIPYLKEAIKEVIRPYLDKMKDPSYISRLSYVADIHPDIDIERISIPPELSIVIQKARSHAIKDNILSAGVYTALFSSYMSVILFALPNFKDGTKIGAGYLFGLLGGAALFSSIKAIKQALNQYFINKNDKRFYPSLSRKEMRFAQYVFPREERK